MSVLKLTIDRQSEKLVTLNGSPLSLPALFEYNVKPLQIQVVDPISAAFPTYSLVDLAAYGLRVGIWPTPTGTAAGPASLALQTVWVWDAVNKWFTGSLDLGTAALESYIGALSEKTAYFEVTLTLAGERITLLQELVTLKAVGDEGSITAPTPADTYYTKADSDARFFKKVGDAGEVLVLKSPNGLWGRELGVADDGSAIDNIINL
jgi:hypothetical protein